MPFYITDRAFGGKVKRSAGARAIKSSPSSQITLAVLLDDKNAYAHSQLRPCLAQCIIFSKYKILLGENFLCKGKYFLLLDCIVEIMQENYFLCLILHVKNLFP